METVFRIRNCSGENQINFSTCTLLGNALTWWNSHVRTVGNDIAYAMTRAELKKKMTDKYCPMIEIKKLEVELWELKVKGTDVIGYNQHFQELALLCGRMFPEEFEKIEKYIGGLPNMIHRSAVASKLKTMIFVSTAFISQIDITPTALDHYYEVELADGRIIGLNTILRGCTLNILNHPFNIDLMPVELGSFDAIIGMDWFVKYQAIIVCAERIVRIPWGNETLIVHSDGRNWGNEARLHIISYTKTQEYMLKGCPIFLENVTTKETKDKSKKKRLEDVPIV
ncbi:putative reverse transcriptase domain-containing protein [Tanacetum coccineum]|uniref:Reverse transcriptase domain-containing protein n=1 Tax=Tanacetum coccineum TaxID=301880 RepID=A0ABQ4Z2D0_9ASTR